MASVCTVSASVVMPQRTVRFLRTASSWPKNSERNQFTCAKVGHYSPRPWFCLLLRSPGEENEEKTERVTFTHQTQTLDSVHPRAASESRSNPNCSWLSSQGRRGNMEPAIRRGTSTAVTALQIQSTAAHSLKLSVCSQISFETFEPKMDPRLASMHSFSRTHDDSSTASSKATSPHSAI